VPDHAGLPLRPPVVLIAAVSVLSPRVAVRCAQRILANPRSGRSSGCAVRVGCDVVSVCWDRSGSSTVRSPLSTPPTGHIAVPIVFLASAYKTKGVWGAPDYSNKKLDALARQLHRGQRAQESSALRDPGREFCCRISRRSSRTSRTAARHCPPGCRALSGMRPVTSTSARRPSPDSSRRHPAEQPVKD
jgi:hypothetical protein